MKRSLLVTVLVIIWICSCGDGSDNDSVALTHTILRYNQLLAKGYAEMNMSPLQQVATEQQALKVYNHMSALGEAKIRMESELVDIEFLDTQLLDKDSAAKVKTREKWNYTHVSTDEKMPSQTVVQGLIYTLSYDLVKKDDRWLVSSVTVLEEQKAEDVLQPEPSHQAKEEKATYNIQVHQLPPQQRSPVQTRFPL